MPVQPFPPHRPTPPLTPTNPMAQPRLHPHTTHSRRQWPVLTSLSALVLLGHWTLLMAAPLSEDTAAFPLSSAATWVFTTRSIEPPAPQIAVQPAPTTAPIATSMPAHRKAHLPQQDAPPVTIDSVASENEALSTTEPVLLAAAEMPNAMPSALPSVAPIATTGTTSSGAIKEAAASTSFVIPDPARLKYEVKGVVGGTSYTGGGELLWQHDGKAYNARLAISKFFIPLRVQTSKGQLGAQGLEPTRFGDKKGSEVAAHFERQLNKIVFSANTPDAPLLPGGQDQLSVFIQLGALMQGSPKRYGPGTTLTLQAVGSHYSEQWTIVFGKLEKKSLPGGELNAIKLTREPEGERDTKVETWFAPDIDYLPVHIRLSQKNGDFVDMLWSSTEKP